MKPYTCRRLTQADLAAVAGLCMQAQADYWTNVKEPMPFTADIGSAYLKAISYVATDGAAIVGTLVATLSPPTVMVATITTSSALKRAGQQAVVLSLMLALYDEVIEPQKLTRGEGLCEAADDIITEVFESIGGRLEVSGTEPFTGRVQIYRIVVEPFDAAFRAAVVKELAAL